MLKKILLQGTLMPKPTIKRYKSLKDINSAVVKCKLCPELREYCQRIATEKRRSFADWNYWGKPVQAFGDHNAKIMIVGLAPAAHGANRTGRMFTGDRSGDFLYAGLYRAGLANQANSTDRDDGLQLSSIYITAACRCAPPANKLSPAQLANCRKYLINEILIMKPQVIMCLGMVGWNAAIAALRDIGMSLPRPKPKFAHGSVCKLDGTTLLGCYHVSQQNTFTGKLTENMLDEVLNMAKQMVKTELKQELL